MIIQNNHCCYRAKLSRNIGNLLKKTKNNLSSIIVFRTRAREVGKHWKPKCNNGARETLVGKPILQFEKSIKVGLPRENRN